MAVGLAAAAPASADNTNSNTNDNTNTNFGAYLGVDTGGEKTNWPPTQIDWPPSDIGGDCTEKGTPALPGLLRRPSCRWGPRPHPERSGVSGPPEALTGGRPGTGLIAHHPAAVDAVTFIVPQRLPAFSPAKWLPTAPLQ